MSNQLLRIISKQKLQKNLCSWHYLVPLNDIMISSWYHMLNKRADQEQCFTRSRIAAQARPFLRFGCRVSSKYSIPLGHHFPKAPTKWAMIEMAINKQVNKWRRFLSPFLPYFMEYSEGKKLELWGLVFSSLWPWYGFSIPMVQVFR